MAAAHRRAGRAGALLRGVGLGQALPAVLAVAFLAGAGARRRSWLVRFGASSAGVVVVAYLPPVAAVGAGVVGYLPGYLREERYDQGGRYLVAGLSGCRSERRAVVAGAALADTAVWVLARRPPPASEGAALLSALLWP